MNGRHERFATPLSGRELLACAAVVFIAPAFVWLYFPLSMALIDGRWTHIRDLWFDSDFAGACILMGWPFALWAMVFGAPLVMVLKRHENDRALALIACGAAAAVLAYVVFHLLSGTTPFVGDALETYSIAAVVGAHCGLCYWTFARSFRPRR